MAFINMSFPHWVLQFAKFVSVVTVQRGFYTKCRIEAPTDKTSHAGNDHEMLGYVRQELDHRTDFCRITRGAHMEHLEGLFKT